MRHYNTELISDQLMDRLEAGAGDSPISSARFQEVYGQFFERPYCNDSGVAWGATERAVSLAFLKEFCETHKEEDNLNFRVSIFFSFLSPWNGAAHSPAPKHPTNESTRHAARRRRVVEY